MGFRSEWLSHEELLSVHNEVFLHAVDRVFRDKPIRLLLVGVGNGGDVQIWRRVLPEGSSLVALDRDAYIQENDLGLSGDVEDWDWVRGVLRGQWFDLIVDSAQANAPALWPFLVPGGAYIVENYRTSEMMKLMADVDADADSWLPTEEIMSVMLMPTVLVIEKRNPRVVPYLDVIVGRDDPVVPESWYARRGAKRVVPHSKPGK